MEVEVAVGRVDRIDPANSEIEVGGKDRALQGDTVTDFPVVPPRQIGVDYAACAIFFPRRQLFGRHDLCRRQHRSTPRDRWRTAEKSWPAYRLGRKFARETLWRVMMRRAEAGAPLS